MNIWLLCQAIVMHKFLLVYREPDHLAFWGLEGASQLSEASMSEILKQPLALITLARNDVTELCPLPDAHRRYYVSATSPDFEGQFVRCPRCAEMRQNWLAKQTGSLEEVRPGKVIDFASKKRLA
jgi:hypothetical protein